MFGSKNNNIFGNENSQLYQQEEDIINDDVNFFNKKNISENNEEKSEEIEIESEKEKIDNKLNDEFVYNDFKYFGDNIKIDKSVDKSSIDNNNEPKLNPFRFSLEKEKEKENEKENEINKNNYENNYNNLYINKNKKQDTKEYIININNKKSEENIEEEEEEEEEKIKCKNIFKKNKNQKLNIDNENSEISEESEEQIIQNNYSIHMLNLRKKIGEHISKRKPISRKIYSNLIQQMIHLTEKKFNNINEEPNKSDNDYNEVIENYINLFENKLQQMKNGYIYALVKKHFCENEKMKKRILIQENIPQKRNNVKKCYNELMLIISNKLKNDEEIQKYFYNVIIDLLHKFENITEEDLDNAKQLYKENKLETLKNIKYIIKYNDNEKNDGDKLSNNGWVKQIKTKKTNPMKLISIVLPLAFAGAYIYNFIKS